MRINYEMVTAATALVIGACALVVSIYEVGVLRSEQRAQVWPYLDIDESYGSEGFQVVLQNKGTGPAIVKSVEVELDDQPVASWDDVITRVLGPGHSIGYDVYMTNGVNGEVLPAGDTELLFGVPWTDDTRRLVEGLQELNYKLCFCSVLDECWSVSTTRVAAVDDCPTDVAVPFR